MEIKSFAVSTTLSAFKYIASFAFLLFIWAVFYTIFTSTMANAMTSKPPLVKPWVTQQNTTDWVRAIKPSETAQLARIGDPKLDQHWAQWQRVLKDQPIISAGTASMAGIYKVQADCNGIFTQTIENLATTTDQAIWGKEDFWATPDEFLAKGAGDCEDFAICKYYALRKLGFKPEQLNIWSGTHVSSGIYHAVLAVELNGTEYVLDNLYGNVFKAKDYMNRYFQPRYRTNEQGWTFF